MLLAAAPEDATANEAAAGPAVRGQTTKGPSGLPLPRFVSLKAQPVNMRKGPGTQYPATWVMRRVGMPLQIVREYDVWREVIDADGARGWVLGSLLSGRRTAIVAPWDRATVGGGAGALVDLFASPSERARTVARMEAGTSVSVVRCDGRWCRVRLQAFRGHVRQQALWGVYQGETID
ncbi:MAG: SH3 domain-containing protein [Pseudomonadota bacterium]